jgi:hypothetical protein
MYGTKTFWDIIPCCRDRVSQKHSQTSLQCVWKCCGRQKHRWSLGEKCGHFRNRKRKTLDLSSSSRPVATISHEMLQRADAIVREDRRITTRQLAFSLPINKGSVGHIVRDLLYSKTPARWVPRSLTVGTKTENKAISSELLEHTEAEGEIFLSHTVTANETWVMAWHPPQPHRMEESR